MSVLFSTKVSAVGGRAGHVRSDDGLLDLALALPPQAGGAGGATNPEQLFAAGYAACFASAVQLIAPKHDVTLTDADIEVQATVGLALKGDGGFALKIDLDVIIAGVTADKASDLAQAAHQVCPYSNAVRGNIDVGLTARAR